MWEKVNITIFSSDDDVQLPYSDTCCCCSVVAVCGCFFLWLFLWLLLFGEGWLLLFVYGCRGFCFGSGCCGCCFVLVVVVAVVVVGRCWFWLRVGVCCCCCCLMLSTFISLSRYNMENHSDSRMTIKKTIAAITQGISNKQKKTNKVETCSVTLKC